VRVLLAAAGLAAAVLPATAQVCTPDKFSGAYGFQLAGTTDISGAPKPVSSMGRLEFDGRGGVRGKASVNFDGFLLGNPVTGSYQVRTDCSIEWSLQDTSGAFQHFAGRLTPDFGRATFRQTDRGGAREGRLVRLPETCSTAAAAGRYRFSLSGSIRPMETGGRARRISIEGLVSADPAGNLVLSRDGAAAGAVKVGSDCVVEMDFIPQPDERMKLRGVLAAGGSEILAINPDPGAAVNARFTRQ